MAKATPFPERPKPPESLKAARQLVNDLWDLVQELREVIEQLRLNSSNSSLPPSQDRLQGRGQPDRRRPSSGKPRGAQAGHVQHTRTRVPVSDVDHLERYFPDTRCRCGGEIVLEADPRERHQVFDLPQLRYTVPNINASAVPVPGVSAPG